MKDTEGQNYLVDCVGRVHWGEAGKIIKFLGVWDTVPGPYKLNELQTKYRFGGFRMDPCVEYGVHILSIDEQRWDFSPLLWNIPAGSDNPLQIWMPSVHSDIGGGYKNATLSNVSLLTMLDVLTEKCPDVAIDDENFIDEVIIEMCKHQNLVINDELEEYIPSAIGFHHYRNEDMFKEESLFHPITKMMCGSNCVIRGKHEVYNPFYKMSKDFKPHLVAFKDDSYWNKVKSCLRIG